jgi:hypothetical protein
MSMPAARKARTKPGIAEVGRERVVAGGLLAREQVHRVLDVVVAGKGFVAG